MTSSNVCDKQPVTKPKFRSFVCAVYLDLYLGVFVAVMPESRILINLGILAQENIHK